MKVFGFVIRTTSTKKNRYNVEKTSFNLTTLLLEVVTDDRMKLKGNCDFVHKLKNNI